jgi:hypothetical protein
MGFVQGLIAEVARLINMRGDKRVQDGMFS